MRRRGSIEVWIAGGAAGVQTCRHGGMECLKLDADVEAVMRSMLESWISDESFSLSSSAVETSKSTGSDVEASAFGRPCQYSNQYQGGCRAGRQWRDTQRRLRITNRILAPALGKRETRETGRLGN